MKRTLSITILLLSICGLAKFTQGQSLLNKTDNQQHELTFRDRGEVYFTFQIQNHDLIKTLTRIISIDNVNQDKVYAYANEKEFMRFLTYGIPYTILIPPSLEFSDECYELKGKEAMAWDVYPTYEGYENMMNQFVTDHPDQCRIIDFGTLNSGRKMLAVKISSHVDSAMNKPQFFYGSSIHGDEVTCYVNLLRLIDYLLVNYNTDPYVTNLVDNIEIYICPLLNPDGTYHNGNNTLNGATRYNAMGVDLNRNFPDPQDGLHPDGNNWQQETVFYMNFASEHHFVMSANFHGGAEVVNYPWDTWPTLAADDNWWYNVSRRFADTVHEYATSSVYMTYLDNGVTNGYAWYEVAGGRQDYMNYWHHCRESCIEVSNTKKPSASNLPTYWNALNHSLLQYMEECMYGIRGIVTNSLTGAPLHARVYIAGHDIDSSEVYSHLPVGNYHRLLFPGTYNLTFTCPGYYPKTISNLQVNFYQATWNDVQLVPLWTGVEETAIADLQIYPNPVIRNFTLKFQGKSGKYTIELLNTLGKKCFSEQIPLSDGARIPVNIANYPNGVYLIKLTGPNNQVITKKLIKE